MNKKKFITPAIYALAVILLLLFPLTKVSPYIINIFIIAFINIIAAVSLRLIITSGQFPMAHASFMAVGAYMSAVVAIYSHWSPWLTIPLGGITAAIMGALIGLPFARLRALYYALASMFFGQAILQVILAANKWTNSYGGLNGIPRLLPTYSKIPYYYIILGVTVVCLIAMYRLEQSRIGINLKAIAQSHLVAASVGISEVKYRVLVLGVGCFFVGIAGAFLAHYTQTLDYTSFGLNKILLFWVYAWVGGIGNFAGPIVGASLLVIAPELMRWLQQYVPYVSAVILLLVVYIMPKGLAGIPEMIRNYYNDRIKRKKAVDVL